MKALSVLALTCVFLIVGCSGPPRAESTFVSSLGDTAVQATNLSSGDAELILRPSDFQGRRGSLSLKDTKIEQVLVARLDGKLCALVLVPKCDDAVRIYEVRDDSLVEIWRGIPRSLKPWKVQVADVDGDGKEEIGVGVYKKARFHPVMAKRPFIYGWDGKDVYAKWLGSRLSRPFTDFVLADFGGPAAKLVAIEETQEGDRELAVYGWKGFGFIREWNGARAGELSDLGLVGPPGRHRIRVSAGDSTRTHVWDGKGLKPEEEEL